MDRVLRQRGVLKLVGLSRVTVWRLERDNLFPRRRRIGRQAVGWVESEIKTWLATRPQGAQPAKCGWA